MTRTAFDVVSVGRLWGMFSAKDAMFIFNWIGLGMAGAAFGVAYLAGLALSRTNEPELMVIGGFLSVVIDGIYRAKRGTKPMNARPARRWIHPKEGGQLFFAPLWALGLVWIALGTYRLLSGSN